jgi:hypothetical protein
VQNAVEQNGIAIVRTPTGIGVDCRQQPTRRVLTIEVDYAGRRLKCDVVDSWRLPWRDYYPGIDMLRCAVCVKDGERVLAELGLPEGDEPFHSFMVLQGPQTHVTEAYVSCPPALTIVDEVGATWTLGFKTATKAESPEGEFAFQVLRDGVSVHEIASRIERRNGKIRVLTKSGYKVWDGHSFF